MWERKESKFAERGKGIVKVDDLFIYFWPQTSDWAEVTTLEQNRNPLSKIIDLRTTNVHCMV